MKAVRILPSVFQKTGIAAYEMFLSKREFKNIVNGE